MGDDAGGGDACPGRECVSDALAVACGARVCVCVSVCVSVCVCVCVSVCVCV
jgi:hypothetical protein